MLQRSLHYRKRFGQNFLRSKLIAQKIVNFANVENEIILEIGAGKGILTRLLARKAKKIFAVEIDKNLVEFLKTSNIPNIEIIHQDFLKINLKDFNQLVIVGNIPYSITTPILEKLVNERAYFKRGVLTIQKEYGERILAEAGESQYGSISIYINYYFLIRKGFLIPPRFFSPPPKVSSMVVLLEKREPPFPLKKEKAFFDFIQGIFRYRRKILKNAIINYLKRLPQGIDETLLRKRPEELNLEDFKYLYDTLEKII